MGDSSVINLSDFDLSQEEIPPELLEELEREIKRNEEANRLAKEKEREAKAAKERAVTSQRKMQDMVERFDDIKSRVNRTRQTLVAANTRIETQEVLRSNLAALKERATRVAQQIERDEFKKEKLQKQQQATAPLDEPKIDYALTVQRLQEKLSCRKQQQKEEGDGGAAGCVGTTQRQQDSLDLEAKYLEAQAKLQQITLSKESLQLKQAQLVAIRKEKEMALAEEMARKKEEEAKIMRFKVGEMQRQLAERKKKLQTTEHAVNKKDDDVGKMEKLMHNRERKANYAEKKRLEILMFGAKGTPGKKC